MQKETIRAYIESQKQALIDTITRLVAIPSLNGEPLPHAPFGSGPAMALDEAIKIADELGLSASNLDGYVGVIDCGQGETALHILAHLDVVPAGDGWTITNPFKAKIIEDIIYGRGVSDDKGPLVAVLFALKTIQTLNIPLSKHVRFIMGTDEESGFRDIHWYYENYPHAPNAFSPDSEFPVTNIEKGHLQPTLTASWSKNDCLTQIISIKGSPQVNMVPGISKSEIYGLCPQDISPDIYDFADTLQVSLHVEDTENGILLTCIGQNTHASTPEAGNNALTALISILLKLPLSQCEGKTYLTHLSNLFPHDDHYGDALGIAQQDPLSGPLTATLSVMDWTRTGFTARFDSRLPLSATHENCYAVVEKALSTVNIDFSGTIDPAHHVDENSPFVQTLLRIYNDCTGEQAKCQSSGGGTYVHGIEGAVAFGACMPNFEPNIHGPNECMSISDLLTACEIFTHVIIELCGE